MLGWCDTCSKFKLRTAYWLLCGCLVILNPSVGLLVILWVIVLGGVVFGCWFGRVFGFWFIWLCSYVVWVFEFVFGFI